MSTIDTIKGIGPAMRRALESLGITDPAALAKADVDMLTQVRGISPARAESFIEIARSIGKVADSEPSKKVKKKKKPKLASKKTDPAKGKKTKKDKKNKAPKAVKTGKDKKKTKTKSSGKGKKKS